ncbi:succinate dehydrogenase, hydrophobic membrane anchor protein [Terrihabitans soli]|uniref:Succinate dehydrogenase hydrophobic membrane anchor subunit n=1 Tax=Terrihabitans soli TaxID=708113 RepID=A0A6S6QSL1_9HYPH|nr:succinate dehydrogenase, hydrophobic membrane anchor protein [Terrihabitans soli]BCJ89448.1 succinate dehydrogenase, hydrophobic membrane anchor protein [Terrihabitans soli]
MVARTPFARVRGLGASGTGTREYWLLKLTSVALLPLTVFLIGFLIAMKDADHAQVTDAIASPFIAVPLFFFILANAKHMRLGMQNVIDDYVHDKTMKKLMVGANIFFSYGGAAAAFYFLLKIGLGG